MTRRPKFAAAAAVALFVVGQLAALVHEAETRHVTCAEHGEQLEAATLDGHDDLCGQSHLIAVDGNTGAHEDCDIARLLRTSTRTSQAPVLHVATDALATHEAVIAIDGPRAADVLVNAPKTSPPA
ncbi:MAG TPA: hypothetical protein VMZ53_18455 [Kofleriaceae bacterium]|nr:hypothetical protein [Kofleriaceae bacterium]